MSGLFNNVNEPLDVDAVALYGILLLHLVRGQRRQVERNVDVSREIVIDDRGIDELDVVSEAIGVSKVAIVDGDYTIVCREMVGEIRLNEPSPPVKRKC